MEDSEKLGSRQFREQLADDLLPFIDAYLANIWPKELYETMLRDFDEFLDWLKGVDE